MRSLRCEVALLEVVLLAVSAPAVAQEEGEVVEIAPDFVSEEVVPDLIEIDLSQVPVQPDWQPGDPIREVPRRATHVRPDGWAPAPPIPGAEDALLAAQADAPRGADAFTTPLLNFDGQNFTGVNPADPSMDVGPGHVITLINTSGGSSVTIYDKTGNILAGPFNLDTLATSGNCTNGLGDPVVLYDSLADRWFLSELGSGGNHLCVYVSQTANPVAGGWFKYDFVTPNFPDYPKYAVWPDAYYASTNENSPAVYALNRAAMLAGSPASLVRFTAPDLAGFPFQALTPADLDGASAPPAGAAGLFMRHRDDEAHNPPGTASDFLEVWQLHVDWITPANSTFTGPTNLAVTEFSSNLCGFSTFSCIPQPSGTNALDPLREVVMFRLQYRNFGSHETLAGNLVTNLGPSSPPRAGVRWFELRRVAGAWSLFQEGTLSPDATNRWMGASAMDRDGNFALGFSVSSPAVFPGLRYAGRLATDPAGTLPQGEATMVNGAASNASIRWGDYFQMGVDPADDCTFWFYGAYSPLAQWRTRVAAFKFDSCGTVTTFQLDVSVVGSGTVTSEPAGISCPADCTEAYLNGTPVALTPTPAAGWQFTGWSGACTGTGACNVSMTEARAVTATFTQLFMLSVNVTGSGTVTSEPAGISCPADCSEDYLNGTTVDLTPTPAAGWQFTGWSGACTGTGACSVTMSEVRSVGATFDTMPFIGDFETGDTSQWSAAFP